MLFEFLLVLYNLFIAHITGELAASVFFVFIDIIGFDTILQVFNQFFSQDTLTGGMKSLSAGLVTVTIAIAIFLGENGELLDFDRKVILKEVVKSKYFASSFLLLFLPLFLWDLVPSMRFLLFIAYFIGVFGFMSFLYRSYKWINEIEKKEENMKGDYRQKKRRKYLDEVPPSSKNLNIWEYVWELDHISVSEEKKYVERYVAKVTSLLDNRDLEEAAEYLISLRNSLTNIDTEYPRIFEQIWKPCLDWHETIYWEAKDDNNTEYLRLKTQIDELLKNLINSDGASKNGYHLFSYLSNKFQENNSSQEGREYLENLIGEIAPVVFSIASDDNGKSAFWTHFEDDWRTTKDRLENADDNFIALTWLNEFLDWAEKRILRIQKEGYDRDLDVAMKQLFPNVDHIDFSIILLFVITRPQDMEKFVKRDRNFGHFTLSKSWFGDPEDDTEENMDKQKENAIKLGAMLVEAHFTEEYLNDCIKDLESISFDNEQRQNYCQRVKEMLEKIRDEIDY